MYLSDRDLELVVRTGQLIVKPPPDDYDPNSIDLHLDAVEQARAWDVGSFLQAQKDAGGPTFLRVAQSNWQVFSKAHLRPLTDDTTLPVHRDGRQVIVRPGGFFLWQTREEVGTPEIDPRLVCFVNGRSSIAREGLLIHITAPTIHAGWWGRITLELANLGPFDLALSEGDVVAQIVVAALSSPPRPRKKARTIGLGQSNVLGEGRGPST